MSLFALLAGLSLIASAHAAPVVDPATGHSYELVMEGKTWPEARAAAAGMGSLCYLATITSQAENDFVVSQLLNGITTDAWIGGEQLIPCVGADNNDASLWGKWVTGEPWSFTNWAPNAPDDCPDPCLKYTLGDDTPPDPPAWDEEDCSEGTGTGGDETIWYVVECEPVTGAPVLSKSTMIILVLFIVVAGCWVLKGRSAAAGR